MKKIIVLAVTASALLAGPDLQPLVDYDAQDLQTAEIEEAQQVEPAPIQAIPVIAPAVAAQRCHQGYIDLMGGRNFTQESAHLDDAATAGIRVNKCLTDNLFVQVGYDRVFGAEYKNEASSPATAKAKRVVVNGSSLDDDSTHLDRFYLNGLYEFNNQNRLYPYVYAGLGYENVSDEAYDVEDQGFYNAGAGLRYSVNEKLNLIADAKAIKKFKNSDLDMVAALGLGIMFGASSHQSVETPEVAVIPQPDVVPSIIAEPLPLATVTQPIVTAETVEMPNAILVDSAYYIQIAALFKSDLHTGNPALINKIRQNGLDYEILDTTIRGKSAQLLLVGPYYSDAEARADLSRAKNVEKGAFIKKIKG